MKWYRAAANAGDLDAHYNLAIMVLNGEGCDADTTEGLCLLQQAALSGHHQSSNFLEDIYTTGLYKVMPSEPIAKVWHKLSKC